MTHLDPRHVASGDGTVYISEDRGHHHRSAVRTSHVVISIKRLDEAEGLGILK